MNTCTFFGHRDVPKEIEPTLRSVLTDLIENKSVTRFYVGNQGGFDSMVFEVLRALKNNYPHINYCIVLAYLPCDPNGTDSLNTVFPEGIENSPKKFAISKRNEWMIDRADFVITYVKYTFGGAYKYKAIAERKRKVVINLADN